MVKQTRLLVDSRDVLQLRIVCRYVDEQQEQCTGEVLYQFGPHKVDRSWRCPKCGSPWQKEFASNEPVGMRQVSEQEAASFALINALETLTGSGCAPFGVQLEFDAEPEV